MVTKVDGDWLWLDQGWVHKEDVRTVEEALDSSTEAIRLNPKDTRAYFIRGHAWYLKHNFENSIQDFTETIRLDPENAEAFYHRGVDWQSKREFLSNDLATNESDKAIEDFTEAIRIDPQYTAAYGNRAYNWEVKGELDKAMKDYTEANRLDPDYGSFYNRGRLWQAKSEFGKAIEDYLEAIRLNPSLSFQKDLAWIYATCPEEQYRNGEEAIQYAKKACEITGWHSWDSLDVLAAAYAETGDFANAIRWQKKTLDLAPPKEKPPCQERLDLYRSKKPFRDMHIHQRNLLKK